MENKAIFRNMGTNILNLKHKKDLITIDLRTKQIRYLKDYKNRGEIFFINLSSVDLWAYNDLIKNDYKLFLKSLKEDIKNNLNINITIKNIKQQN